MRTEQIVLSIETGILGGSLSLLKDGVKLENWNGEGQISKAENVLEQISNLLKNNNVAKEAINLIVVSNGPGSMTGLRIGQSLGRGLGKSLNCSLITVSVLEAMNGISEGGQKFITAVPVGKDQIGWQLKDCSKTENSMATDKINFSTAEIFFEELNFMENIILILHQVLFERYEKIFKDCFLDQILQIQTILNLAEIIGRFGAIK